MLYLRCVWQGGDSVDQTCTSVSLRELPFEHTCQSRCIYIWPIPCSTFFVAMICSMFSVLVVYCCSSCTLRQACCLDELEDGQRYRPCSVHHTIALLYSVGSQALPCDLNTNVWFNNAVFSKYACTIFVQLQCFFRQTPSVVNPKAMYLIKQRLANRSTDE